MRKWRTRIILSGICLFGSSAAGQQTPATAVRPAPRNPDGHVRLGTMPGEIGMWLPANGGAERLTNPVDSTIEVLAQYPNRPALGEVPFQSWARALHAYRRANQFEPHTRCKPSAGPRQFLTPYGVEFVEFPESQRILIMDEGGPHTFRTIYMDGREHPAKLDLTYYGHSVGHWGIDTLVVDTVGFNEAFWIDRTGLPHTSQLHMIERFTRLNATSIKYQVTIEDPGAYTKIWNAGFMLSRDSRQELFEYVCQDNNHASELMLGNQESVDRRKSYVP